MGEHNVTTVADVQPPSVFGAAARRFAPASDRTRWATPGAMAVALDPRTRQTPALERIDQALVEVTNIPDGRLIISMPPQEGKSQRVSRRYPLWVLAQNRDTRVVIASYEFGKARRWGRAIRDDITVHGSTLGMSLRRDLTAQHEWQLAGHEGGVYCVGIGGALTGTPADLMVIDDPLKGREEADSEVFRRRCWDWWLETASTRLAPGAPVVLILTRWHHADLAGKLLGAEDGHTWRLLNIPAEADHRPEQGETDPLGREPGEFMVSARRRTTKQWTAIKTRSLGRTWTSLYQGKPNPETGNVFPALEGWSLYDTALWLDLPDGVRVIPGLRDEDDVELIQSWDMAFKSTASSDYVVGQVWLRRGVHAWLLDQIHGRKTFVESCAAVQALSARWPQAVAKLIESAANGPAVISALGQKVPGMIPITPQGSKYARAVAVSPLVTSHNVHLPSPSLAPWVLAFVEEAKAFPASSHDDQVDGMSQALNVLLLTRIVDDQVVTDEDLDDGLDGFTISPI